MTFIALHCTQDLSLTSDDLDLGSEQRSLHADPSADLDHQDLPSGGCQPDGVETGQVRELSHEAPQLLLQPGVGVVLLAPNLKE